MDIKVEGEQINAFTIARYQEKATRESGLLVCLSLYLCRCRRNYSNCPARLAAEVSLYRVRCINKRLALSLA